jgi:hypothetical protein
MRRIDRGPSKRRRISCGPGSRALQPLDDKLLSGAFDLVILSAMLSQEEKRHIEARIPAATRPLVLETLVWPKELLSLVSKALV